jgi:flagellar protein FliS
MYTQAYSAYQDTNVKTASQGKLVVLLYEGAVRHLTEAVSFFNDEGKVDPSHIEKFGADILKTQEIITELQVSLNMDAGGDIAKSLMSLYVYFNNELTSAHISQDKKKLEFVCNMMTQLLGSWRAAANSTANAPAAVVRSALDIQG